MLQIEYHVTYNVDMLQIEYHVTYNELQHIAVTFGVFKQFTKYSDTFDSVSL